MTAEEYRVREPRHPEPCSMAWPGCSCIPCIVREIEQQVWTGLFSSWGEWPR